MMPTGPELVAQCGVEGVQVLVVKMKRLKYFLSSSAALPPHVVLSMNDSCGVFSCERLALIACLYLEVVGYLVLIVELFISLRRLLMRCGRYWYS